MCFDKYQHFCSDFNMKLVNQKSPISHINLRATEQLIYSQSRKIE